MSAPTEDDRGEEKSTLAALEEERQRTATLEQANAALRAQLGPGHGAGDGAAPKRRRHRFWVTLLLVLAAILTPIMAFATYAKAALNDTNRYVNTVAPLAKDPAIQTYVASTVTNRLFQQADVSAYVTDALPPRAQPLAGPLTSALRNFTDQATLRALQSNAFQTVWVDANRAAHTQVVNILSGKKSGVVTASENGAVTVNLSQLANQVKQRLSQSGITVFDKVPSGKISGQITVFSAPNLYKARNAFKVVNAVAFALPFVLLALLVGAIYLSANRRRGFMTAALAFAIGAVLLAVLLAVGRSVYLNAVTPRVPYDAAAAVYDTLLRSLWRAVRTGLAIAVIVVIAAFFAGPSKLARAFRRDAEGAAGWLGDESDRAGWRIFGARQIIAMHKTGLRIAVAAIAFVVFFFWKGITALDTLLLALLVLLALALIEFFGRTPRQAAGADVRPAGGTAA